MFISDLFHFFCQKHVSIHSFSHLLLQSTIGVDFHNKSFIDDQGKELTLQLWDTAGQEKFRSLALSYLRLAHCVCLVFDVTSEDNLRSLTFWHRQIAESVDQDMNVKIGIIANKVDLKMQRVVSEEDIEEIAEELGVDFVMEVSAKTGLNVRELFDKIADEMRNMEIKDNVQSS